MSTFSSRISTFSHVCVFCLLGAACSLLTGCGEEKEADLTLMYITDVHGLFFPGGMNNNEVVKTSMANFSTYLNQVRAEKGADHTILLCGGDLNEGQPSNYYYNNVAAVSKEHISAKVANYFGFDAIELGANDITAGPHIWRDLLPSQCNSPYLCANLLDNETKQSQLKPYTVFERQGFRIAVLGLIDPNDCRWLSPDDLNGLQIADLVSSASRWVNYIKKNEKTDFIIGLFAAGTRNQSLLRVPGIDVFLLGSDHRSLPVNDFRLSSTGDSVLDVQPFPRLEECAQVDIHLSKKGWFGSVNRRANVQRVRLASYKPDSVYLQKFADSKKEVDEYMNMTIGNLDVPLSYSESLFGPSALVDLMHDVQMDATGADISITNNCSEEVDFMPGAFTVSDLFHFYKYNHRFWVIPMTGEEIHSFLESTSFAQFNQMARPSDHILAFRFNDFGEVVIGPSGPEMSQQKYKFCSAFGIKYTVDVTRPKGERVTIVCMSDGGEFDPAKTYKVVMNDYLACGGGNYIFQIVWKRDTALNNVYSKCTDDARTCFVKYMKKHPSIAPVPHSDWKIVPEDFCDQARQADAKIMQRYMSPM